MESHDRSTFTRFATAVLGMLVGLLIGLALTLAMLTGRALFQQHYIESAGELIGPTGAPLVIGIISGAAIGWLGMRGVARLAAGALGGAAVGVATGVAIAIALSDWTADHWAGGVVGGALGALVGSLTLVLPWLVRRRQQAHAPALVLLALAATACSRELPEPPPVAPAPPIEGDAVEGVIILIGDPGKARYRFYPILPALAADVERWATRIGRDSAVVALVLGDIVYPDGMHAPNTPGFAQDSARVEDQIDVVRGPAATRFGARMVFVAGNHDWGLETDRAGARRLRNLEDFLDRERTRGAAVELLPEAGTGMPAAIDVAGARILLLDTAWWLFDAEPHRKRDMLQSLAAELAAARDRPVVIAAHHPLASAGPHGALTPVLRDLGIRYLLSRSGTILQDLESRPYRDLLAGLEDVFRHAPRRPLLFAGGHEHSLQVIRHEDVAAPWFSAVSGTASKLTSVGWTDGMLFREAAPGWITVVLRESGAVDLFVIAAPERFLACPDTPADGPSWERCMNEGMAAFRTVFSMRLQPARAAVAAPDSLPPQ